MSRTATATPPPPYFPQRNATPTMRHCAVPTVSAVHFSSRHRDHHPKKKIRKIASSAPHHGGLGSKQSSLTSTQQAEYGLSPDNHLAADAEVTISPAASISSLQSLPIDAIDIERSIPTPSLTTSSSNSFISTNLPTPSSSRASSLHVLDSQPDDLSNVSADTPTTPSRQSWVPYLGKMAKAVVSTGFGFTDKRKKSITPPVDAVFVPTGPTPQPTREELEQLSEEAAMERRREWAMEQQRRVTECARLCSQWPHSGYNQSKWGPNGARTYYEPQSYANPQHVASLMARQADLERNMHEQSAMVFTCRRSRASSEESDPSDDSYESSLPSPTASMCLTADLSAAMASPLMPAPAVTGSQISLLSSIPSVGQRNEDDLDGFAQSIALDPTAMDIDSEPQSRRPFLVRPARAQSCGAKRPLTAVADEEEKRRKVDEAMVVEEAVETGVMMRQDHRADPPMSDGKQMSAFVPDLSANKVAPGPSIFGHIVKTSDTHPIIISPFFPADIIPTIAEAIVIPAEGLDASPLQLGSKIDVPSLLLAQQLPHAHYLSSIVPSPVKSAFDMVEGSQHGIKLGNLLLSSCPGKRLRMEGPVKGRGPVCRDLATDLRRIKNEGVGCLVCCLDDPELSLLGVPWETYSQVAMETGLDVIRLPMPDGFTPVSLSLFDNQVSLIVKQYSLRGINVLVHCRGGVGRAGLTASAWAIKMGFVPPHPSLSVVEEAAVRQAQAHTDHPVSASSVELPIELEHQITMSIVERVIAMIRARRGLKAIESFEQVQFLASYVRWLRSRLREEAAAH